MEAFEQFVAVALQAEHLVVSGNVKFPVKRKTKKEEHDEWQTHGYEVDLVGANATRLVLATVKSFFGSRGVQAREVRGDNGEGGGYRLLNDEAIRNGVIDEAARRYGYSKEQVSLRLYVGKFASTRGVSDEAAIRTWCDATRAGGDSIKVFGPLEIIEEVRRAAQSKTYVDNAVIVAMKVLAAADLLDLDKPLASNRAISDALDSSNDIT